MDKETQQAAEATDPVDPLLDGQTTDEDEDDLFGEPPGSDLDDPADDDW